MIADVEKACPQIYASHQWWWRTYGASVVPDTHQAQRSSGELKLLREYNCVVWDGPQLKRNTETFWNLPGDPKQPVEKPVEKPVEPMTGIQGQKDAEIAQLKAAIEKKKAEIEKNKAMIEKLKLLLTDEEILTHRKWGWETRAIEKDGRVVLSDEEKGFVERFKRFNEA
jgi:hypothetical protein